MGSSVIRNMADSYVAQATPKKNFGSVNRMHVGTGFYSYLFWGNPAPKQAKIISAKLHVYSAGAWTGSVTLTAQRMLGSWSANKVNWNNDPTTTATNQASQAKTGAALGTHWVLDITAMMQAVSDGAPWYGVKLSASGAAAKALFSMQAGAARRPYVEMTWSDAPLAPSSLTPRDGQAVSIPQPILAFNFVDVSGNKNMAGLQVQIASNPSMTTIVHDSGQIAGSIPHYDLSSTAGATVGPGWSATAATTYYWRVRTQDGAGIWSGWSDVEPFQYLAAPTLTLSSPSVANAYVEESTPPITWTFSGTQTAYQVLLFDGNVLLWDSGRVTSTNLYATIVAGKITQTGKTYTVFVRVWDNKQRVASPGVPPYQEGSQDFVYQYNPTTTPVNTFTVTQDGSSPAYLLRFFRATPPDYFTITRNGVVIKADVTPASIQDPVDSTKFVFRDYPPGRRSSTWEVAAVVNGKTSTPNPTVNLLVNRRISWLQSIDDPTVLLGFANPDHDLEDGEIAEVMQALDGPPALVTQSVFGESGTFSGTLSDNIATGYTARQMRDHLRTIRKTYGGHARLTFLDESMEVYIFKPKVRRVGYPDGSTDYDVTFQFIQVG